MKTLLRTLALLTVLVAVVAIGLFVYIDAIAKRAVVRGATHALGVPTTVERADVEVFKGTFSMEGLAVANPPGFEARPFLQLDRSFVAVTLASLRKDTIELPALSLTGLDICLEKRNGASNYQVILDNLKRFEVEQPPTPDKPGGRTFVIREVLVRDITVHVDFLPMGGELTRLDVPVEEIRLTDIGSETDRGVLLEELTGIIVKAVLEAVVRKAGGLIPSQIAGELQNALAGLASLNDMGIGLAANVGSGLETIATGSLEQIGGAADAIGRNVGGALDEIGKGLGDLLGGAKEPKADQP